MLTGNDRPRTSRNKEDVRVRALEGLKQALATEIPGHECEWAKQVGDALNQVEEALRASWGSGKTSDGPLASVDKTRPTLARETKGLHDDHDRASSRKPIDCAKKCDRWASHAFQPEAGFAVRGANTAVPDFGATRQRIEQFLAGP